MAHRILVVDDAAFMRMMLKDILTKNDFEIVGEAEDGKKALEKYKELQPDLVTMDITMPEMDGIEAVKQIKNFDPEAKDHHLQRHGAASHGNRCHSGRGPGFYCKTLPA